MRALITAALAALIRIFFRRVEISGREHVPAGGPVIFAGNHPNALIDPVMLLVHAGRPVSFMAKEPLFRTPVIGWFVRALDSIPIYRRMDQADTTQNLATFDAVRSLLIRGGAIAIFIASETIQRLQTGRLPLAGKLEFQLRGGGPFRSPRSEGTARVADLRVGEDRFGSFEAALRSDGRRVHVDLSSTMENGQIAGQVDATLGGDYPFQGDVTLRGIDMDPFIENALRLKALTGHSSVDGRFRLNGAFRRPETITVEADIAQLKVDYQYLKLENAGPLRFVYSREEVRIEQAHIRGPDTDFVVTGTAGLTAARALDLNLAGTVNLQLATGIGNQRSRIGPDGHRTRETTNEATRKEQASNRDRAGATGLLIPET